MKITNHFHSVIVLPQGVGIAIGATVDYPEWNKIKDMPNISWYVDNGHLTVEGVAEVDQDAGKDDLIAQLKEMGIKADKRSSVESLQEKLDEALAK